MSLVGKVLGGCYAARAHSAQWFYTGKREDNPLGRELAQNGIVILKKALPLDLIEKINEENCRFFDFSEPAALVYSPDGKALLEGSEASSEALRRFYFLHVKNYHRFFNVYKTIIPFIDSILKAYYRSNYYVRDVYCYRTQPVENVQGSYSWHTDNYPAGCLKVMTYLTDVGEGGGPFAFALKSHLGYKPRLGEIGDRYTEDYAQRFKIIEVLAERGTVIIFNNNACHRATDPVKGLRDVVNFTVFPCVFPKNGRHVKGLDLQEEKAFFKKYTR